jgi:hypothetical protein
MIYILHGEVPPFYFKGFNAFDAYARFHLQMQMLVSHQ